MVVLDLFAGHGGVTKALEKLGRKALAVDVKYGSEFDITLKSYYSWLCRIIRSGLVVAVMMAPPCTTFSRARRPPLRSSAHPWGLPEQSGHSQLIDSNKVTKRVIGIIKLCLQLRVPLIVENPNSSMFWFLPQLQQVIASRFSAFARADFCQFGTAWRKPTRFLCVCCDSSSPAKLSQQCHARGGICKRTHKSHIELRGRDSNNILWTRIAEPYPRRLCVCLAEILDAEIVNNAIRRSTICMLQNEK